MHFFTLFSLAQAVTAAPLIVPRGVDESESKFIVVMKTNAVSKTVQSTVARIASNTDYTYSNLFNGFSASLTKSQLKDLLNNPNVDFIRKSLHHAWSIYPEKRTLGSSPYFQQTTRQGSYSLHL
jgi:hypothetical protein